MYGAGIPAGEKERRGLEVESGLEGWMAAGAQRGKTGDGSAAAVCAAPEQTPF